MDNATLRFVYDRINETGHKKKIKGKKYKETGLLQIEIRQEGTDKRIYISSGVRIKPDQYSDKNGFTCKNHDNAKAITGKAIRRFREIESFALSSRCKTLDQVKFWDKDDFTDITIEDFINSELKRKNAPLSSINVSRLLINRLKEYNKIKYFTDLEYNKILEFDELLRTTVKSSEALKKRHTLFKGYIQGAIDRGIYKGVNPYVYFTMPRKEKLDPVYLTDDEVLRLKNLSPDYGYLERVRDLFLFQCYTGLAYIDLMKFTKESVFIVDGYKTIKSSRVKTDENYITLLLPEAERIADKYNYQLPKITNQKYNEYLKDIASMAGINKTLVTHSARHTFATYLLNKDIPIETVARALGHASIKQTQHYARLLGKKVVDDMKKLL